MSNDQKAHDFAIMLTNYYLNNPKATQDEIANIYPRVDNLVYDPYSVYKYIYTNAIKYFDEDFKE